MVSNKTNKMNKLKFKEGAEPTALTDDFWYMIYGGGWCKPENFLEDDDAKRLREAIELIAQYENQGIEEGYFEEC